MSREISENKVERINSPGTIRDLKILPLVEYYSESDRLKTEAGVSYYIAADDLYLLLDVVANARKQHPSPLLQNMKALDKTFEDSNFLFISHAHLDHLGGMQEQKERTFSVYRGLVTIPTVPVYSPVEITPSVFNQAPKVQVITETTVIKNGVISIGSIPRALYLMGYTLENSLAFNVEGKGIVLVLSLVVAIKPFNESLKVLKLFLMSPSTE